MFFNSSSNTTLGPPPISSSNFSNSSLNPLTKCHFYETGIVVFTIFTVTNVLLLFLYILVLYMGIQQWRRQRSVPGGTSISHSDIFTHHMVVMEIIGALGFVCYNLGISTANVITKTLGIYSFFFTFSGQSLLHCLTCMERYLAVVHPVTYMSLRERSGVRNISIGCVWLLCFGWIFTKDLYYPILSIIVFLSILGFSIIVMLFCNLMVLCVLVRPRPGGVGGDKAGACKPKQRALCIISAIFWALLLRCVGYVICFGLKSLVLMPRDVCPFLNSGIFLILPSSLVLPLLFLHKAGKLACCRPSTGSA